MDVLGKVCLLEYNDEVIESGLEDTAYEALVKVLMVPDIKVSVINTLWASLRRINVSSSYTETGNIICKHIDRY